MSLQEAIEKLREDNPHIVKDMEDRMYKELLLLFKDIFNEKE